MTARNEIRTMQVDTGQLISSFAFYYRLSIFFQKTLLTHQSLKYDASNHPKNNEFESYFIVIYVLVDEEGPEAF